MESGALGRIVIELLVELPVGVAEDVGELELQRPRGALVSIEEQAAP